MSIPSLSGFLNSVSKKQSGDKFWENYIYIAASEWNWSVDDIFNAPIPLVLQIIEKRNEIKKAEESASKRKR